MLLKFFAVLREYFKEYAFGKTIHSVSNSGDSKWAKMKRQTIWPIWNDENHQYVSQGNNQVCIQTTDAISETFCLFYYRMLTQDKKMRHVFQKS